MASRSEVARWVEAAQAGASSLEEELESALAQGDPDKACALMLAGLVLGRPPTVEQAARVLPDVPDPQSFTLLAANARGDRLSMLLSLLEGDQLPDERDALALLLATELMGEEGTPPRLLAELRERARRKVSWEAVPSLAAAAAALKDAQVFKLDPELRVKPAEVTRVREALRKLLSGPVLEQLTETVRGAPALTVRHSAPRPGRNEPCHCGSGKKYKRCCADADAKAEARADPSEKLKAAASDLQPSQVAKLRVPDLLKLDLASLKPESLVEAYLRLTDFHRWEEAEKVLEVIATRADLPGGRTPDDFRLDYIGVALAYSNLEGADRQRARLSDPSLLPPSVALSFELLRHDEPNLRAAEAIAEGAVRRSSGPESVDLAYALIERYPGLGILVARGALCEASPSDSEQLLEELALARERLGLPGEDRGWELFEALMQHRSGVKVRARLDAAATAERDGLLRKVAQTTARMSQLEEKLREASDKQSAAERAAPSEEEDEERRRLKGKVAELKAQIATGNEERLGLRRSLAELSEKAAEAEPRPAPRALPEEAMEEGEEVGDVDRPRALLVPHFERTALDSLEGLPARVAKDAVLKAAELATGNESAWRDAKKLSRISDLLSARVGIHHRLLFRVVGQTLKVEEVVPREGFQAALRRRQK